MKYKIGKPATKLWPHNQHCYDRTVALLEHGPQTLETLNAINWDNKGPKPQTPYGDYCLKNGWIKEAA